MHERLIEHKEYIAQHGDDMPAIGGWKWGMKAPATKRGTSTEGNNL
jgi:xylulose-5-phosphate/fructose-6-phosphate phosphoketolase